MQWLSVLSVLGLFLTLPPGLVDAPTLADTLSFVIDIQQHLAKRHPTEAALLAKVIEQGICLTTSYSGLGTPELAACVLVEGHGDAVASGANAKLKVHSASDISPAARELLIENDGPSSPLHVFGDVVQRLVPADAQRVRAVEAMNLDRHSGARGEEDAGKGLVNKIRDALDTASFRKECWCYCHDQLCPLNPSRIKEGCQESETTERILHMEVAGVTCTPWSSMNRSSTSSRWLDKARLPSLVLCHWIRHCQPSVFVIENVRAFDAKEWMVPLTRDNQYTYSEVCISPKDLGIPSSRTRKFIIAVNTNDFAAPTSLEPEKLFQQCFARPLLNSVKLYSAAGQDELRHLKREFAASKGLLCVLEHCVEALDRLPMRKLLPGALSQRQEAYMETYEDYLQSGGRALEGIWVDLNQNVSFYKRINDIAPPLLRSSKPWNLLEKRAIALVELLACMGFCPPGLAGQSQAETCQLQRLCDRTWPWKFKDGVPYVPDKLDAQISGNGTHVACIGNVLAMALILYAASAQSETSSEQL